MKKIYIIFAALSVLVSCAKEEAVKPAEGPLVFRARLSETIDSRMGFAAGKMTWEAGDVVRIGNGTAWADVTLSTGDISPDGRMALLSVTSLAASQKYYAVYPAANCGDGLTLDGDNICVNIPSSQTAANVFTCVASCEDDFYLTFHHPATVICVSTPYSTIDHVCLRAVNGEPLAGSLSVNPATGEPTWISQGASVVSCPLVEKKAYIEISHLGYFTGGLALDVYDSSDNLLGTVVKNGRRSVARNTYYNLATGTINTIPVACIGETSYTNFATAINAFNADGGTLTYYSDYTAQPVFSCESGGIVDMAGNTQSAVIWMRNNTGDITLRNGVCSNTGDCFDGYTGFNDGYTGKVILENMTVLGILWTDSHPFEIRSGDYNKVRNMYKTSISRDDYPNNGSITITGGSFKDFQDYVTSGWACGNYYISGGKFAFDPTTKTNVTILPGYSVQSNPGPDSATYPYIVL